MNKLTKKITNPRFTGSKDSSGTHNTLTEFTVDRDRWGTNALLDKDKHGIELACPLGFYGLALGIAPARLRKVNYLSELNLSAKKTTELGLDWLFRLQPRQYVRVTRTRAERATVEDYLIMIADGRINAYRKSLKKTENKIIEIFGKQGIIVNFIGEYEK